MSRDTVTGVDVPILRAAPPSEHQSLVAVHGVEEVPIGLEPISFGRDEANSVRLVSPKASRRHAVIYWAGDRHVVRDLHSRNGVTVNGQPVRQREVRAGDVLNFDEEEIELRAGPTGEVRLNPQAVVVSCDTTGYTRLTERYGTDIVEHLRELFERIADQALILRGCPVRNLGGGIVVAFGVWPIADRRFSAADAALELARHAVGFVPQEVYDFLDGEDTCDLRIGLAIGDVHYHVGDGLDLSGDAANVAKHLETTNKNYGTRVMMSGALRDLLRDPGHIRELDTVRLPGRTAPTVLHAYDERSKLRQAATTLVTHQQAIEAPLEYLRLYEAGLTHYRAGVFPKAFEAFEQAVAIYRDRPSRCMRERVVRIMEMRRDGQLPTWDGIWNLGT